jgi:2-oxoglutarate dehydrogenase E1 component
MPLMGLALIHHRFGLGQVYYMLVAEREARGLRNVVISRLEQISPFPYDLVRELLLMALDAH